MTSAQPGGGGGELAQREQPARPQPAAVPIAVAGGPAPKLAEPLCASEPAASASAPADLGRSAFTPRVIGPNGESLRPRQLLETWLQIMVEMRASDLILRAAGRPAVRVDGKIEFLPGRVPASGAMLEMLEGVVGKRGVETWRERGAVDTALHLDGLGRFRLNAYRQMSEPAIVLRRVAAEPPDIEDLHLPAAELKRLAQRKRGLVLVTGIAGSGKTTTLASMIQFMNKHADRHVVTLEDPVEILFSEERCVISQREVGADCASFHEGLRHALRQSPDVILIGEMRDRETVSAALDAVETGHLVLSTLHTVNAAQTLDRVLGFFPAEQHAQVCIRLSDNVAGVISQRLVPRSSGRGMVPACELMTTTPRIRELLEKGQTIEIMRTIEMGSEPGLTSFNQSLRGLVEQNLVELEVALSASDRPDELMLGLRGYSSGPQRSKLRMGGAGAAAGATPGSAGPSAPPGVSAQAPHASPGSVLPGSGGPGQRAGR